MDLEEGAALIPRNAGTSQWRKKCCRVLKLSLSLFVFLVSFPAAVYTGFLMSHSAGTPYSYEASACLLVSLISSTLFVFWLTESDSNDESNIAAIPIRVTSVENYQTMLKKSLSDQGNGAAEPEDPNIVPLLLISSESRLSPASTASLTESLQEGSPQDSNIQATSESLQTKPVEKTSEEASQSISVKDSSCVASSDTATTEEVRQRKITPPVQKDVPDVKGK